MYSNNEHLFAPPYSQESAVGLVMAVGNHGQYLDGRKGAPVNTYLSRDGGYKWSQIAEIPLIYEFGDHGAILVAAPNTQSTTQIRYSWNEGKTWTKLKVSNDPIYIDNIIIEPKSTSQQFIIYGSYDNSTEGNKNGGESSEGGRQRGDDIMITLDFSGLHEPKCTGVDNPGTEKSDFELWSPHDDDRHSGHPNKCYLGQQVTYVRRKQDSECFNGEDFERQVMRVPCLCTERDYECDVNFVQDADGKCAAIKEKIQDSQIVHVDAEDCAETGFHYTTTGYRKIPGNKCYGGLKLEPVKKPCSHFVWLTTLLNFKTIVTVGIVVAVLYYGWPIIEALVLVLPIPDPKDLLDKVKALIAPVTGILNMFLTTQPRGQPPAHSNYQSGLSNAPASFIEEDDDSDDDVGKPSLGNTKNIDYDSDDKGDEEMVGVGSSSGANELIDLGGDSSAAATNIPKLSAPKK